MEAEKTISTELAKQNVTEAVIANLKKNYLPLKINGIDDTEGYKKVHDARIVCRDHRTLTEKICKKGREDAIKEQKAWIAKGKEIVAQISEVEQHLKKQEDVIDAKKEAIKIRKERLLKLPGRKEQVKGIEEYIEGGIATTKEMADRMSVFNDEWIMGHDDVQWQQIIFSAKEDKFTAQQKVIDDANAKKLLERTIARENGLIAVGAVLYSDGTGKVYRKGSASVTEQTIKECIDEGWPKIVEVFQKVIIPEPTVKQYPKTPSESYSAPVKEQAKDMVETSDEEKLFNYASALEHITIPDVKTDEGRNILNQATERITLAINILRK